MVVHHFAQTLGNASVVIVQEWLGTDQEKEGETQEHA